MRFWLWVWKKVTPLAINNDFATGNQMIGYLYGSVGLSTSDLDNRPSSQSPGITKRTEGEINTRAGDEITANPPPATHPPAWKYEHPCIGEFRIRSFRCDVCGRYFHDEEPFRVPPCWNEIPCFDGCNGTMKVERFDEKGERLK
jgi:hypothetical protein